MGFSFETSVPVITVFVQGLLSFLSPCVLPLVPLYLGYLAGGGKKDGPDGQVVYPRRQVLLNTIFFIIGISFTFFLLGFGFTALGQFFSSNRIWFARVSGIIMIFFGLYQFGLFGHSDKLEQEHRFFLRIDRWSMGPIPALLLGFTFSFAWTPCVGPVLGSVVLMAGSSGSMGKAAVLIGVYTLGFTLPFLAVGIFTTWILNLFRKYRNIVKYTVKVGAVLLIFMGIMTLTGFMNSFTGFLSNTGSDTMTAVPTATPVPKETTAAQTPTTAPATSVPTSTPVPTATPVPDPTVVPAPDFTLVDQYGKTHILSEYQGKTVFLNFWATWCPPCKGEMPDIQELYEKYGENDQELIVLGVAGPNHGQEGSVEDITAFLAENEYTFPVVMDETGDIFGKYGITSFPTTFMITAEGEVFGYVPGAMTMEIMESIVSQTMLSD